MARPAKNLRDKQASLVLIRFTEREKTAVARAAAMAKLPLATFVRIAALRAVGG